MFVAYNEKSFVPAFLRSLLITYLEPEKERSKNLYVSCIDFCATDIRVTVEFINLTYYWQ